MDLAITSWHVPAPCSLVQHKLCPTCGRLSAPRLLNTEEDQEACCVATKLTPLKYLATAESYRWASPWLYHQWPARRRCQLGELNSAMLSPCEYRRVPPIDWRKLLLCKTVHRRCTFAAPHPTSQRNHPNYYQYAGSSLVCVSGKCSRRTLGLHDV